MTTNSEPESFYAKHRKQILLGVLGAIGLLVGGDWLVRTVLQGPLDQAHQRGARYQREIEKRENALKAIRQAGEQLAEWEKESLPSNPEAARSLYQAWLLELVDDCKFQGPSVNSGEPATSKMGYFTITYSVRARTTLQQFTRFLYTFYHTNLLHQILSISLTPVNRGEQIDVSLTIEAIGLPGAGPAVSAKLSAEERQRVIFDDFRRRVARASDKLASATAAEYAAIYERNLFGVGGSSDPMDITFLTSVVVANGEPQAWFDLRATGQVLKLRPGDPLDAGQFHGIVAEIQPGGVVLESSGQRWLIAPGETLTTSSALPPEY